MGDMREERSLSTDLPSGCYRLLQIEMRHVRGVLQGVEDEDVQALEHRKTLVGDSADIRAIGDFADSEAEHRHLAVEKRDGDESHAGDLKRPLNIVAQQMRAEDSQLGRGLHEGVSETLVENFEREIVRPHVERAAAQDVKSSHVIEAENVVGVGMGIDDGFDHLDALGDALEAEFGRGVDQDIFAVAREYDRWPGARITRIGRCADRAAAADHGNAGAGARTEK